MIEFIDRSEYISVHSTASNGLTNIIGFITVEVDVYSEGNWSLYHFSHRINQQQFGAILGPYKTLDALKAAIRVVYE